MKMRRLALLAIVVLILAALAIDGGQGGGRISGAPKGKTQRVRFARGRTTAGLHGAVVRGTQDRYILGARAGQSMIVHVTSREKNAVFALLGPDATELEGAGEGVDAMDWTGKIALNCNYLIWVGP